MLYEQLEDRRRDTARRLADTLREETVGTPQAITQRDAAAEMLTDRLAGLRAAEHGLAFGRLDADDGEIRYVGRIGLLDEDNEYEPLLMDWRAPAARPFYTATAANPEGMRRRRHLRTRLRQVVAIDDEPLNLAEMSEEERARSGSGLTSEAALLAAVSQARTGRMGDIVATIQGEQDRIIRSKPSGVLVVQGGPGTGKTAVALHRAAYLLYTHRDRLARRGVLVVGPNPTFLRYIGQVLPSLGETSVVLGTVAQLFPGLDARRTESPATAELKGRAEMAPVIAAAVRDRQQLPRSPVELVVEQQRVVFDRDTVAQARTRARRSRKPHNEARRIFRKELLRLLAQQVARRVGGGESGLLDRRDVDDIRDELAESAEVAAQLEELWPTLSPEQLLTDLFADRRRLNSVARRIPAPERALLERPAPGPDVPRTCAGPRPTSPCSTRRPSCSASTAPPRRRPRPPRCARRSSTPRACSTCSTWRRTSTPSCCAPPTSSTPTGSPSACRSPATTPPPSGLPRTVSGPTATSSSTRRRSSRRWPGGWSCAAPPPGR